MHKLTLALLTTLALAGIGQAQAAPAQDACVALMEARGHLVNMLASGDKAVLDDLNGKVQAASGKLDGILNAMERGYNAADAQKAGDAEHVAFLRRARFNQRQGVGLHGDAAFGHRDAVRAGLGADVDHVGLALGVEVGERGGGVGWRGGCLG